MNAGDTLALLGPNSQLIFDSSGNLVGIQNPRANGVDFRISPTSPSFTTLTVSGLATVGGLTVNTSAAPQNAIATFNQTATTTEYGVAITTGQTDSGARNWALELDNLAYGDFTIKQSLTKGGNPLATGALARLYISPSGAVSVFGLFDISGASAGQIKFPATQNASADANTLDDYEEGTWTPTDGSGASLSLTINNGPCTYVKIGQMVYACFDVTYPVTANGSDAIIASLPFAAKSSNPGGAAVQGYTNLGTYIIGATPNAQANIVLYNLSGSAYTNANMSAKRFAGVAVYQANA